MEKYRPSFLSYFFPSLLCFCFTKYRFCKSRNLVHTIKLHQSWVSFLFSFFRSFSFSFTLLSTLFSASLSLIRREKPNISLHPKQVFQV